MTRKLETYNGLQRDVDDLEALAEMAEDDEGVAAEVEEQFASVESRLEGSRRSGCSPAPTTPATRSSRSTPERAGPTPKDWAEMVLRMEMRWAEKRGSASSALEVSPGGRSGHQVRDLPGLGRDAYGLYGARRACRLVRLSPFDSAHRRQTSFAGVEVAPRGRRRGRGRDRRRRPADRHLPGLGRRRAARQQDRLGGADHPPPTGIVVQCQNERSQSANKATAMAMSSPSWSSRERKRLEEIARERGEAPGRELRLADPLLRPAHPTRWSRTTARRGGSATPSACSMATSTLRPRLPPRAAA